MKCLGGLVVVCHPSLTSTPLLRGPLAPTLKTSTLQVDLVTGAKTTCTRVQWAITKKSHLIYFAFIALFAHQAIGRSQLALHHLNQFVLWLRPNPHLPLPSTMCVAPTFTHTAPRCSKGAEEKVRGLSSEGAHTIDKWRETKALPSSSHLHPNHKVHVPLSSCGWWMLIFPYAHAYGCLSTQAPNAAEMGLASFAFALLGS